MCKGEGEQEKQREGEVSCLELPLQLLGLTFVLPAQKHLRHPARHIQQQELVLVRKTILDE